MSDIVDGGKYLSLHLLGNKWSQTIARQVTENLYSTHRHFGNLKGGGRAELLCVTTNGLFSGQPRNIQAGGDEAAGLWDNRRQFVIDEIITNGVSESTGFDPLRANAAGGGGASACEVGGWA